MTDKQIIDVTQCPYHKEDKTCTYLPYKSKCEGDCNWTAYKEMEEQLKAKEQECEELKQQLTILDDEDVVVEITVEQFEEYKKLEQTLAEIKEIAEENDELLQGYHTEWANNKIILHKISECEVNDG